MDKVRVGVVGAGGYTGGEIIRLLVHHEGVKLVMANSQSQQGKPVHNTHSDLLGETELKFTSELQEDLKVLFLCLGHGESKAFLEGNSIPDHIKIIDLSQDFRIQPYFHKRQFIYGLPEWNRERIKKADNIAGPGCFATALQLSLLPLIHLQKEIEKDITIFGTTGSTGAGRAPSEPTHFSWRNQNLSIYKAFEHQHLVEVQKTFQEIDPQTPYSLTFIPQRGNFSRGILVSALVKTKLSLDEVRELYSTYYAAEPFVFISDRNIDLKSTINTNKAFISFEKQANSLLINLSLDNLIKGASGQALQNMNIMMGFEEKMGLKLKSIGY